MRCRTEVVVGIIRPGVLSIRQVYSTVRLPVNWAALAAVVGGCRSRLNDWLVTRLNSSISRKQIRGK